ncbi:MAG: hypothetical protein ACYTXE_42785 [Nostoc sp.]
MKTYKKKVAIAHKQHRQAHSKCCCCLRSEGTQMHHTEYTYTNHEKLGINWFPLCNKCHHEVAHSSNNWIKNKADPVRNNKNTEEFIARLKLGFKLLYGGIKW